MKTIELLAQTVNILNEYLAIDDDGLSDREQPWMDMSVAKLEQEGYSEKVEHHTTKWTRDT